ncbi:MAG: translocation/assembly module TamB domain-containing protein [Candidatus Firestonebacteria bacterium]
MKKKPRKILIVLVSVFLILFLSIFILAKTGVLVKSFKNIIQSELSKALNREVTIESIEGGIFNNITLNKVRIASKKELKDGTIIVIEKLTINYSLKDIIFNKKSIIESIKSIQIKKPFINIEDTSSDSWNILEFIESLKSEKQTAFPFKCKINVYSGLIGFKDNKKKFSSSIKHIYGNIDFAENSKMLLDFKCKSFGSKRFNLYVKGNAGLEDNKYYIEVKGSNVNIPHYANYINPALSGAWVNFVSGEADFSLKFKDDISGEASIKNTSISLKNINENINNISGELKLKDNALFLSKFVGFLKSCSLSGHGFMSDFKEPSINLNLYVNHINLEDLVSLGLIKNLKLKGSGFANFVIKGKLPDMTILSNSNFNNLKISEVNIDKVDNILKYENNVIKILRCKANAFEGVNNLAGTINLKEKTMNIKGESTDININKVFSIFKFYDLTGKASLTHQISGGLDNFIINSKIKLKELFVKKGEIGELQGNLSFFDKNKLKVDLYGQNKLDAKGMFAFFKDKTEVEGKIKIKSLNFKDIFSCFVENSFHICGETNGSLEIKGELNQINLLGELNIKSFNFENYTARLAKANFTINDNTLNIKSLEFNQDNQGIVKAEGTMELIGDIPLNITVKSNDIEISKLPVVYELYNNIKGRSSISGQILGSINSPKFVVSLNSSDLIINPAPSGGAWVNNQIDAKFDTNFTYENNALKIENLVLDDEYNFSGEIIFLPKKYINGELLIRKGKLATLLSLFKLKFKLDEVKGDVFGNFSLKGEFNRLNGNGSLNLKNAIVFNTGIELFTINFLVKESDFQISKLEIIQNDDNKLFGRGMVSLKENAGSNLNIKMQNKIQDIIIEGEHQLTGVLNTKDDTIKSKVKSINLFLNQKKTDNISFNMFYNKKDKKLSFDTIRWNKMLGNVGFDFNKKSISSLMSFDGFDIEKLSCIQKSTQPIKLKGMVFGDMQIIKENDILNVKNALKILNFQYNDFKCKSITTKVAFQNEINKYIFNIIECTLSQEEGNIKIIGEVNFKDKISLETSDSDVNISFSNANLNEIIKIIGLKSDLNGRVFDLSPVNIKGKISTPSISGEVKLQNVKLNDLLLGDLKGEFNYKENQIDFSNKPTHELTFTDLFNNEIIFNKAVFRISKNAIEPDISCKAVFKNILGLRANATVDYKGRIVYGHDYYIDGGVSLKELKMNEYRIGDGSMKFFVTYKKDEIKFDENTTTSSSSVDGKIIFSQDSLKFDKFKLTVLKRGSLSLDGILSSNSALSIGIKDMDIQFVLRYFNLDFNMMGKIGNYEAVLTGDSKSPVVESSSGHLTDVDVFNLSFDVVTGDLSYVNNKLKFENVSGVNKEKDAEKYRVSLNGFIPINAQEEIDLHVDIKNTDLKPIMITKWFNKVEGRMNARFDIGGTLSYPEILWDPKKNYESYIIIEDGSTLYPVGLVKEINNVKARFDIGKIEKPGEKVEYKPNFVNVVYCRGTIDGSYIEAQGSFTLKKFFPDKIDIKIKTPATTNKKGVKFFIESMMNKEGLMFVKGFKDDEYFYIDGTVPNIKLNGEVYIYNANFTYPPVYKNEDNAGAKILKEMIWNLLVVIKEDVWYYNNYCKVKLKEEGWLKFNDIGSDLTLRGNIDVDRGTFKYYRGQFEVKKGIIKFQGTEKRKPVVNAIAETRIQSYKITMTIAGEGGEFGDLDNLKLKFTSEPELSEREIVNMLAGSRTEITSQMLQSELNKTLFRWVASTLVNVVDVKELVGGIFDFGLEWRDEPGLTTSGPSDTGIYPAESNILQGMEIKLSKYLNDNILLGYSCIYKGVSDRGTNASGWENEFNLQFKLKEHQKFIIRLNDKELFGGIESTVPFESERRNNK